MTGARHFCSVGCALSLLVSVLSSATASAQALPAEQQAEPTSARSEQRLVGQVDAIGRSNPAALALIAGMYFRNVWARDQKAGYDSGYWQIGAAALINPAYAQPSVYFELLPLPFLVLRAEYALQAFVGANRGLLSFDSARAPFGEQVLRDRSAESKSAIAQRVQGEVVLRAKVGRIIARNSSDLFFYHYGSSGPYLYESEFDTLLKKSDFLWNNRLQLGVDFSAQATPEVALVGPMYEVTWAAGSNIRRQRLGGFFYWEAEKPWFGFARMRVYGVSGVDLADPNRKNTVFFLLGAGADLGK